MITLNIKGENLNNGQAIDITLKGSNVFTIVGDYINLTDYVHVDYYNLTDENGEGGNEGMNAGAYLNQRMGELTGMELR